MKKIYLSGPMKGIPEWNYPQFHEAADKLRAEGYIVYNPAEYPYDGPMDDFPLRKAFSAHCKFLCEEADAIALLPGWVDSYGCNAELGLAVYLGLCVLSTDDDDILDDVEGTA